MIGISFPAKFLLLQCVLQNCHCQDMKYIVLFYIDRKNLHFVGGVEKNFNDLVQNAKKVRYIHVWELYIEHVEKLLTYSIPQEYCETV